MKSILFKHSFIMDFFYTHYLDNKSAIMNLHPRHFPRELHLGLLGYWASLRGHEPSDLPHRCPWLTSVNIRPGVLRESRSECEVVACSCVIGIIDSFYDSTFAVWVLVADSCCCWVWVLICSAGAFLLWWVWARQEVFLGFGVGSGWGGKIRARTFS